MIRKGSSVGSGANCEWAIMIRDIDKYQLFLVFCLASDWNWSLVMIALGRKASAECRMREQESSILFEKMKLNLPMAIASNASSTRLGFESGRVNVHESLANWQIVKF